MSSFGNSININDLTSEDVDHFLSTGRLHRRMDGTIIMNPFYIGGFLGSSPLEQAPSGLGVTPGFGSGTTTFPSRSPTVRAPSPYGSGIGGSPRSSFGNTPSPAPAGAIFGSPESGDASGRHFSMAASGTTGQGFGVSSRTPTGPIPSAFVPSSSQVHSSNGSRDAGYSGCFSAGNNTSTPIPLYTSGSGTTMSNFRPTHGSDGTTVGTAAITLNTITAMPEYDQKMSLEELRLEDYAENPWLRPTANQVASQESSYGRLGSAPTDRTLSFGASSALFGSTASVPTSTPMPTRHGISFGSTPGASAVPTPARRVRFGSSTAQPVPGGFGDSAARFGPPAQAPSSSMERGALNGRDVSHSTFDEQQPRFGGGNVLNPDDVEAWIKQAQEAARRATSSSRSSNNGAGNFGNGYGTVSRGPSSAHPSNNGQDPFDSRGNFPSRRP